MVSRHGHIFDNSPPPFPPIKYTELRRGVKFVIFVVGFAIEESFTLDHSREDDFGEIGIGFERRLLDRLAVRGLGGEFNRIRFNARNHGGGGGGGSFSIVVPDLEQGEVARCLIKVI